MTSSHSHSDNPTSRRILEAATEQIADLGAADLALSGVARAAGVSKALIHYHFRDKDSLLSRLVDHLADAVVDRERRCLSNYEQQHSPLAVDAMWEWLAAELLRGDIRVLLELDAYRGTEVKAAARRAAVARHHAAGETVVRLFTILDLRPRIDAGLLASVVVAFVDGLAINVGLLAREGDLSALPSSARVAFDVFWLAMLSLAE
jgi:AcrR family transcriptional regulator